MNTPRLLHALRGHLLEVERPASMPPLRLGTMEMSYTKVCAACDPSIVVAS